MWIVCFYVTFFEHILGTFDHFLFPILTQVFVGVYLGKRALPTTPLGTRSVNLEDIDFFRNYIGEDF